MARVVAPCPSCWLSRSGRSRPGWCSPTQRPSTCASRRRIAAASRRRSAATDAINVHLLPVFGSMPIEDITVREIERWRAGSRVPAHQRELSNKTKNNLLVLLHAIFRHALKLYDLPGTPWPTSTASGSRSGDIQVFSPEEIWSLVRAASSETDGAIFLTAAFTGLRRGELLGAALAGRRLRRLDDPRLRELRGRPSHHAEIGQRAGGAAGARRGERAGAARPRDRFIGEDDFVFAGEAGRRSTETPSSCRYGMLSPARASRRFVFMTSATRSGRA